VDPVLGRELLGHCGMTVYVLGNDGNCQVTCTWVKLERHWRKANRLFVAKYKQAQGLAPLFLFINYLYLRVNGHEGAVDMA
jgi:hypothetical protein